MITLIALGLLAVIAVIATIVVTARDGYSRRPTLDVWAGDAPSPVVTHIARLG